MSAFEIIMAIIGIVGLLSTAISAVYWFQNYIKKWVTKNYVAKEKYNKLKEEYTSLSNYKETEALIKFHVHNLYSDIASIQEDMLANRVDIRTFTEHFEKIQGFGPVVPKYTKEEMEELARYRESTNAHRDNSHKFAGLHEAHQNERKEREERERGQRTAEGMLDELERRNINLD
jgi:hypothetical protein